LERFPTYSNQSTQKIVEIPYPDPNCWFQGCGLCSAHQRPAEGSTAAGGGGLCRDEIQAVGGSAGGRADGLEPFKKNRWKRDGWNLGFCLQHSVFFKVLLFFSWEMAMVGLDARIHSVYPD
jgi:hypothetical protein